MIIYIHVYELIFFFFLQFNVDVSDNRQPINTVTATVIINVTSLKGPPRFTKAFYNVNIPITSAVNSSVENIFAVDNDLEVRDCKP